MDRSAVVVLHQHFFSRVGIGLSRGFGLQTVAQSPGLEGVEEVVKHFSYPRPRDAAEGPPVCWGWFPWEARAGARPQTRVCLQRVCYTGNDDANRPGNFLAHSFFTTADDLEKIDYDIPCLFRWIRDHSPQQWPTADGRREGFVHHHKVLYEGLCRQFGKASPKDLEEAHLRSIAPLVVPVEAIRRQLRPDADRRAGQLLLPRLRQQLGKDVPDALLQACLCKASKRRPVVVVGAGQAETGFELIELLFTLLPYHYRRQLTFSTYAGPLSAVRRRAEGAPHDRPPGADRRLLLTTAPEGRGSRGGGTAALTWVIDATSHNHLLPQRPPRLTAQCLHWLEEGELGRLLRLRDFANDFAFDPETELEVAYRLQRLHRGQRPGPTDGALFLQAILHARSKQVRDAWLQKAVALTCAGEVYFGEADDPLSERRLDHSYLRFLGKVLPHLQFRPGSTRCALLLRPVEAFFQAALERRDWEGCRDLVFKVSVQPPLHKFREALLGTFLSRIRRTVQGPQAGHAGALWRWIEEATCSLPEDPLVARFAARVAHHLCEVLLSCTDERVREEVREQLRVRKPRRQFPQVFAAAPMATPQERSRRQRFLRDLGESMEEKRGWPDQFYEYLSEHDLGPDPELARRLLEE